MEDKPLKILLISQYFWPENFRVNEIVEYWKKKKFQVDIVTGYPNYPSGKIFPEYVLKKKNYNKFLGYSVYRVPIILRGSGTKIKLFLNYTSFLFSSFVFIFFNLKKKKYDYIFTFGTSPVLVGLVGIIFSKITKIKSVIWILDLWPEILYELKIIQNKFIYNLLKKLVFKIYSQTHLVFAQSKTFQKKILFSSGIDAYFLPSWSETLNYRSREKIKFITSKKNFLTIIFTGNIGESQNFGEIIKVAIMLKNYKVRWIIVGGGRYLEFLNNEIKKYNLNNFLLFDQVQLSEIPKYINHADVLLATLKGGEVGAATVPGKISTYINFRKPILGHLLGESYNLIKDNNLGLVSKPGEIDILFKNIKKFLYLKKNNKLNSFLDRSKKISYLNKNDLLNKFNNILLSQLNKKEFNYFRVYLDINKINFNKNFILSGLNLAYYSSWINKEAILDKDTFFWPDGIFIKFLLGIKEKKVPGRKIINDIKIPRNFKTIHVVGNLSAKSEIYLKKRFIDLNIKFTPLIIGSIEDIAHNKIVNIKKDEIIFLTLPTPKQEQYARLLKKYNNKFQILCVGGALEMLSGEEVPVPRFLEYYFESFWRLKTDFKRRLYRLFRSLYTVSIDIILIKNYKNINIIIYN